MNAVLIVKLLTLVVAAIWMGLVLSTAIGSIESILPDLHQLHPAP